MLKEYLDGQSHYRPKNTQEYFSLTTQAFDAYVDFLRDPKRFPNQEINDMTTLLWRLIGNKDIPLVLDQWNMPSISFAVLGKIEVMPMLILPKDFLQQVNSNPGKQLGILAYMASQGRDYYTGKIKPGKSEEINMRARGYEAETLITLEKMAKAEGIHMKWDPFQWDILRKFPNGIKSMPKELVYSTPIYSRPKGFG